MNLFSPLKSFSKYLLNAYYGSGTVLGTEETVVNKAYKLEVGSQTAL